MCGDRNPRQRRSKEEEDVNEKKKYEKSIKYMRIRECRKKMERWKGKKQSLQREGRIVGES